MLASNPLRNSRSETIRGAARVSPLLLKATVCRGFAKRKAPNLRKPSGFHSYTHSREKRDSFLMPHKRKVPICGNPPTEPDHYLLGYPLQTQEDLN